jgi:membrane protein
MIQNEKFKNFLRYDNKDSFLKRVVLLIRVLLVSSNRFVKDDCLMKASGISYTFIISLVPMLTVGLALLTITSGIDQKQDEIFSQLSTFLQKNDINLDISPYLEILKDIISSATQIGAIGFVVLIFSATAILRSFEAAFNQIWNIAKPRPFLDKIIFYFFILAVGPLILVIIYGFALKLTDKIRPSHLYSVSRDSQGFIWMSGERGTLLKIDETGKKLKKLSDFRFDFENKKCIDLEKKTISTVCDLPLLKNESIIKLRNRGKTLYGITNSGLLLSSEDDEHLKWNIIYFLNSPLKDFSLFGGNIFFIKEDGSIFKFKNSSEYDIRNYNYIKAKSDASFSRIKYFDNQLGFLLDDQGYVYISKDMGDSFKSIFLKNVKLEDVTVVDGNIIFIVGESGTILYSIDGGIKWIDISYGNIGIKKVWSINDNGNIFLLILNSLDKIMYSNDLGKKWFTSDEKSNGALLSIIPINPRFGFKILHPEDDDLSIETDDPEKVTQGDLLAVGQFNKISLGDITKNELIWKNISGGDTLFSTYSLLSSLLRLIGLWMFFVLLYTLIPNAKIRIKSAMIGSFITALLFLVFFYSFMIYVKSFSGTTLLIYKALAAIPLFLLSIYCISVITLFGAEITATLHYRNRYLIDEQFYFMEGEFLNHFITSLEFMVGLYALQSKNKDLPTEKQLKSKLNYSEVEYEMIKKILLKNKYIYISEEGNLAPSCREEDFELYNLFLLFNGELSSGQIEEINDSIEYKINERFSSINQTLKNQLQNIKIKEFY